jgi:hypothetical protein
VEIYETRPPPLAASQMIFSVAIVNFAISDAQGLRDAGEQADAPAAVVVQGLGQFGVDEAGRLRSR